MLKEKCCKIKEENPNVFGEFDMDSGVFPDNFVNYAIKNRDIILLDGGLRDVIYETLMEISEMYDSGNGVLECGVGMSYKSKDGELVFTERFEMVEDGADVFFLVDGEKKVVMLKGNLVEE